MAMSTTQKEGSKITVLLIAQTKNKPPPQCRNKH